jgi:hypothetical protein
MEGAQVALPYKISRFSRGSLCILQPDAHVDLQHVDHALQDALQALRDTGMVASSRLATRDDITRLLGLRHVYELEHTSGVAAGQAVDGQGHHERRTLASAQYGS